MEQRIAELRGRYADDDEARGVLDELAQEPEMHRAIRAITHRSFS